MDEKSYKTSYIFIYIFISRFSHFLAGARCIMTQGTAMWTLWNSSTELKSRLKPNAQQRLDLTHPAKESGYIHISSTCTVYHPLSGTCISEIIR
jgi:hypothetical protein